MRNMEFHAIYVVIIIIGLLRSSIEALPGSVIAYPKRTTKVNITLREYCLSYRKVELQVDGCRVTKEGIALPSFPHTDKVEYTRSLEEC